MNLKNLLVQKAEGVATITINRPEKLNALNQQTLMELHDAMRDVQEDQAVRVIVLTGAGDKAFVAGADISEIQKLTATDAHQFASQGQALMRMIELMPKPVIAMVNGYALGGGMELALACHLRVASDNAKLGLPEIKLGILPGFGGTQRLVRLVGRTRALGMTLTGEPVGAAEALSLGLINQVTSPEALRSTTQTLAQLLAQSAPQALAGILQSVILGQDMALESGLALETSRFALCCSTQDMQEGTTAFLEKRPAQFQGN